MNRLGRIDLAGFGSGASSGASGSTFANVEEVEPPSNGGDATLVSAACVDDDAKGDKAVVLWET
jgi:hypothetical protein